MPKFVTFDSLVNPPISDSQYVSVVVAGFNPDDVRDTETLDLLSRFIFVDSDVPITAQQVLWFLRRGCKLTNENLNATFDDARKVISKWLLAEQSDERFIRETQRRFDAAKNRN